MNGRILIKDTRESWYSNRTFSGGFDERFDIKADDGEGAERILTPSFKKALVQLDKAARGDTAAKPGIGVCIDADRAYAVVWNRKSLLGENYKSAGEIRAAAREDARRIKAVLNVFLENPALFPPDGDPDDLREKQ